MARPPLSPRPILAGAWCSIYAVVHVWWALAGDPAFFAGGSPDGCQKICGESPLPGGWLPVGLAGAAAIGSFGLARDRTRRLPWIGLAGLGGAGMIGYCMLFWIGLAMALLVPFGVPMTGPEVGLLLVRGAGVIGGVLAISVALAELRLEQRPPVARSERAPWWGFAAGYLALAGTGVRTLPYLPSLFDIWSREGGGFRMFVVLLMVSGTVLPLALVHRWGRIWPRWTGPLAGRDVPRWLVLGPGLFMGAGLVAYFGVGGLGALSTGMQPADLPAVLMIGGYTLWGLGLLVASVSYARLTGAPRREPASMLRPCPSDPPCSSGSRCSRCRAGSSSTAMPDPSASPRR